MSFNYCPDDANPLTHDGVDHVCPVCNQRWQVILLPVGHVGFVNHLAPGYPLVEAVDRIIYGHKRHQRGTAA